jgi:hypothetical protein
MRAHREREVMENEMATLKVVREYFGMSVTEFRKEWTAEGLTESDKVEIRTGLANGTLTY